MLFFAIIGFICTLSALFALTVFFIRCVAEKSAFDVVTRFFLQEDPYDPPEYFVYEPKKDRKPRPDVEFEYNVCKYLYQSKLFYQIIPIRQVKRETGEIIIEKKYRKANLGRIKRLQEKCESLWQDIRKTAVFLAQRISGKHPGTMKPHPIPKLIELYRLDFLLEGFEEYHKNASDHGADILASYGTKTILLQCKHVGKGDNDVSPSDLNDAIAAREFYQTDYACVITNGAFSPQAQDTALYFNLFLLDGSIFRLLEQSHSDIENTELGISRDTEIKKIIPYTPVSINLCTLTQRYIYRKRRKDFIKRKAAATLPQRID